MSETGPREVESVLPASASAGSGSPQSPGRREVSPEGTTTAPGFPPLAATPAQVTGLTFSDVEQRCERLDADLAMITGGGSNTPGERCPLCGGPSSGGAVCWDCRA